MRIDNTQSRPTSLSTPIDPTAAGSSRAAASSTGESASSAYAPSAELVDLITRARLEPDVRTDRLREVAERLQQGFYGSDASAAQTADALLGAAD